MQTLTRIFLRGLLLNEDSTMETAVDQALTLTEPAVFSDAVDATGISAPTSNPQRGQLLIVAMDIKGLLELARVAVATDGPADHQPPVSSNPKAPPITSVR